MKLEEIENVIHLFEKANISSLEVEDEGIKIKLTKEMTPVVVEKNVTSSNPVVQKDEHEEGKTLSSGEEYIKSPLVGTYHQAPFADGKPFVVEGSKVKKGDKLCIIEAMKVMNEITDPKIKTVFIDIYDCRSEYDFYNRFASELLKQTASKTEQVIDHIKRFLVRLTPKIAFSPEPMSEISLSLGITPQNYDPEEILQLPEVIGQAQGMHIVVCIDEFQQIGEMADSLTIQKRLRGIWQHQRHVSYCLFGSKKHMMTRLFLNRKMPFYQFGEMMYLDKIPTADWVPFICSRFESQGKQISEDFARRICETVEGNSSYVQQLAWNVLAETEKVTTEQDFCRGVEALLAQCSALFEEQLKGLTGFQMNFLRALCDGVSSDFGSKAILENYNLFEGSPYKQVFGHTICRQIKENNGLICIDCLRWMEHFEPGIASLIIN